MGSVGYLGYCYSSSAEGSNGVNLAFHATALGPNNASSRGLGFQLRCLSE
ncbi:hypothetical protein [uncultured Rikenella sp.]|nr:hypothetical protein [uncultured Rikenella sp.]